jgi:hypothetical protein
MTPLAEISAVPTAPELAALAAPGFAPPAFAPGANDLIRSPEAGIREALGGQVQAIEKASQLDGSGVGASLEFGKLYSGGGRDGRAYISVPREQESTELRPNGDGVYVMGRADAYDKESTRIVEKYKGKIDFSEATDVMDDAYAESYARAMVYKHVAKSATPVDSQSAHIPMTLTWVDGVFEQGKKRIAVHSQRVFFHHAKNPQSEIAEGIRRVDHQIQDAAWLFKEGGKAENALGELDEVVLGFDTRGYKEIKDHIKAQEAKLAAAHPGRFRFVYLDEVAQVPQDKLLMRQAVNSLILEHKNDPLLNVIEGVIYSRYTGLLLELKTAEYYFNKGYKILQGGRELFDQNGHYITELDVVVRSPQGVTYLVEAKSARVPLSKIDVMNGKILYKLDTYKKNKARLEQADILGGPLNVVFSVDVGVPPASVPVEGREEYIKKQRMLLNFLRGEEKKLSQKYGFPVSFLFLYSVPGVDPTSPDDVAPPSPSKGSSGRVNERRSPRFNDDDEAFDRRGHRRRRR